jgi:hypothetical protein
MSKDRKMSRALVFETPGELDLRALTLMGTSAKPNSASPIGRFGTGLKYACAVLCRLGTPPVIWVGRNRYEFAVRSDEFRGKAYGAIDLIGPVDRRELPYTTDYGRFWEPWMAYRELEANTVDEGGRTYTTGASDRFETLIGGTAGFTRIIVENEALVACHADRDSTFLPRGTRELAPEGDAEVEIFDAPSPYLYYRGMRVYDLPRPALRTYNVLREMELTEDRTLRYAFWADWVVARRVLEGADEKLVLDVLKAAKATAWEAGIDYSGKGTPSEAVKRAVSAAPDPRAVVATNLGRVVTATFEKPASEPTAADSFAKWPRPWRVESGVIVDVNGAETAHAIVDGDAARDELMRLIVETVNSYKPPPAGDVDEEIPF